MLYRTLPQTPFPILNVRRSYNSVSTTVLHCDYRPTDTQTCVNIIVIYMYSVRRYKL